MKNEFSEEEYLSLNFFELSPHSMFKCFTVKMFSKVLIFSTICAVSFGQAIIFNPPQPQPFNNNNNFPRFLTPPRAITTLNTFVPRALIPPAPPRPPVPRVFDNRPRVYTAPPVFRPIPPAPPTRRFLNTTTVNNNINPRYAFNYGVNDNRVIPSNYLKSKYCMKIDTFLIF
jgi:hypothetical protein